MDFVYINTNYNHDEIELLPDIINEITSNNLTVIICGEKQLYIGLKNKVKHSTVYAGFSPLNQETLTDFVSFISYLHREHKEPQISFINKEDEITNVTNRTSLLTYHLINYIECDNIKDAQISKLFLTDKYNEYPIDSFFYDILSFLNPIINYDMLLTNIYTTSLGICKYKDITKDILKSLSNKSVSNLLLKEVQRFHGVNIFRDLEDCLLEYINLSRKNNERALLFYSSLLLQIAIFSKKRRESSIAILCLLRAVEITLLFYFFERKTIYTNESGIYFNVDDAFVNGVKCLTEQYFNVNNSSIPKKDINKLISLRNVSIFGHGIFFPDCSEFDSVFHSTSALINEIAGTYDYFNECKKVHAFPEKKMIKEQLYKFCTT